MALPRKVHIREWCRDSYCVPAAACNKVVKDQGGRLLTGVGGGGGAGDRMGLGTLRHYKIGGWGLRCG
jgi:hypothetical protein